MGMISRFLDLTIRVGCHLTYEATAPTPVVFMLGHVSTTLILSLLRSDHLNLIFPRMSSRILTAISPAARCLRSGSSSHSPNEITFGRVSARIVKSGPGIYHNRDDSISFDTEQRDYFGWLPAEITRAVPEPVINTIASMVCHAHRMGRKEAHDYLKQFVLEQMRVPDWPHYPMNDLRKMTPPPLTPTPDK